MSAEPVALTDDRIDFIAETIVKGMPDGIRGFCNSWGWRQFARAVLADCAGHYAQSALDAAVAAARAEERAAERERCAAWVDARRDAFCSQHGSIDPDTGTLEFGRGAHAEAKLEYVGELEEIAAAIRDLKPD